MSKTTDYLDLLNNEVGIAPASSQEELDCAQVLAGVFTQHGLDTKVEEFSAPGLGTLPYGVSMVLLFVGVLLAGIGGTATLLVGLVLAALGVVTLGLRYTGNDILSKLGPRSHSQNVVAFREAQVPEADRERPIVIVAHYDTPRTDLLSRPGISTVKSIIARFSPQLTIAVAVCTLVQLLVFLPEGVRRVVWVVGIVASLPMLVWGISLIAGRFTPYTTGAVDNKSSVAAMLSVLDHVCSGTVPSVRTPEQREMEAAQQPSSAEGEPEPKPEVEAPAVAAAASQPVETPREPQVRREVEPVFGRRHGEQVLRALSILPADCDITYIEPEVRLVEVPAAPAPKVETARERYERREPVSQAQAAAQDDASALEGQRAEALRAAAEKIAAERIAAERAAAQAAAAQAAAQAAQAAAAQAARAAAAQTVAAQAAATQDAAAQATAMQAAAMQTVAGQTAAARANAEALAEASLYDAAEAAQGIAAAAEPAPTAESQAAPVAEASAQPVQQLNEMAAMPSEAPQGFASSASFSPVPDAGVDAEAAGVVAPRADADASSEGAWLGTAPAVTGDFESTPDVSAEDYAEEPGATQMYEPSASSPYVDAASEDDAEDVEGVSAASFFSQAKSLFAAFGVAIKGEGNEPIAIYEDADEIEEGIEPEPVEEVPAEFADEQLVPLPEQLGEDYEPVASGEAAEDYEAEAYETFESADAEPSAPADYELEADELGAGESLEPSPSETTVMEAVSYPVGASGFAGSAAEPEPSEQAAPSLREAVDDQDAARLDAAEPEPEAFADIEANDEAEADAADDTEGPSDSEDDIPEDASEPEGPRARSAAEAEQTEVGSAAPIGVISVADLEVLSGSSMPAAAPEHADEGHAPSSFMDMGRSLFSKAKSRVSGMAERLSQLEDGERTDEGPLIETDHSGIVAMAEEDANEASEAERPERPAPAAPDDPEWGKSSYTPKKRAAAPVALGNLIPIPEPGSTKGEDASDTAELANTAQDTVPMKRADIEEATGRIESSEVRPISLAAREAERKVGEQVVDGKSVARRAVLFDLPDPLSASNDSLAPAAPAAPAARSAAEPRRASAAARTLPGFDDDAPSETSAMPRQRNMAQRLATLDDLSPAQAQAAVRTQTPAPVRIDDSHDASGVGSRSASAHRDGSIRVQETSRKSATARHAAHEAQAPAGDARGKKGRHGLFGRNRNQEQESMSEWLGVDEDYNAKESGESIGSWDNFNDSDGRSWKGGAARSSKLRERQDAGLGDTRGMSREDFDAASLRGYQLDDAPETADAVAGLAVEVTDADLREAILAMGDDSLKNHDIWFVATGASGLGHIGASEFVEAHRRDLRGSFIINLESIGAGSLTMLAREGFGNIRRADRRCASLLENVANDLHIPLGRQDRTWADTEATPIMRKSLRGVTVMGLGAADLPAFSRTADDVPENVDEAQVEDVVALITEMIRRS